MFSKGIVAFIKVIEKGKAPELRHVTIGTNETSVDMEIFAERAIEFLRENEKADADTLYSVVATYNFESIEHFNRIFGRQLNEFMYPK